MNFIAFSEQKAIGVNLAAIVPQMCLHLRTSSFQLMQMVIKAKLYL